MNAQRLTQFALRYAAARCAQNADQRRLSLSSWREGVDRRDAHPNPLRLSRSIVPSVPGFSLSQNRLRPMDLIFVAVVVRVWGTSCLFECHLVSVTWF